MTFWIIASLAESFISCPSFLSVLIIVGLQEYPELWGFSDELNQPSFRLKSIAPFPLPHQWYYLHLGCGHCDLAVRSLPEAITVVFSSLM